MNISPLHTDFYQLTMAQGYYLSGLHQRLACFHLFFRSHPFQKLFTVHCGLANIIEFIQHWHFSQSDTDYLAGLKTPTGKNLFCEEFLNYLKNLRFEGNLFATPEGTIVFPQTPLLRIEAPLIICQLLESALLNLMNFSTLIATKAAHLCLAAEGDPVLEFGMRRAQGLDGAATASRAAYIGGCAGTSNVFAGKKYDIPVRGTHAHSWVTAFSDEFTAFKTYADLMPERCVLLVDTYDTLQGVENAILVGQELRNRGFDLYGIRLDSGDMAHLSRQARTKLDQAGFSDTKIIASNALDEKTIRDLKKQHAPINIWGIGTHLITAYDQPALDGVYKLSALQNENGLWQAKIKLSEQMSKTSLSGRLQVKRIFKNKLPCMDIIYDIEQPMQFNHALIKIKQEEKSLPDHDASMDLLVPVFLNNQCVYPEISIHEIRNQTLSNIQIFTESSLLNNYLIAEEKNYSTTKEKLIALYK